MENGVFKLLESATHRTLHAQNFARSSSQASLVLTDLLARYLSLLTSVCAKNASHSGRTNLTARDALNALEEMGFTLDELSDYCATEGKELNRYAAHTTRRMEDLNELRATLASGLRTDRDDAIPLFFAPCSELDDVEDDEGSEGDLEDAIMASPVDFTSSPEQRNQPQLPPRPRTPVLPPSPVSNPTSPARKRLRSEPLLYSPPNIPDHLPPIPRVVDSTVIDPSHPSSSALSSVGASNATTSNPLEQKGGDGVHKPSLLVPSAPVALQPSTATSASDYTTPIPYSQSTLAQIPEWHLPPSDVSPTPRTASGSNGSAPLPTPRTQPALIGAYHHILTHPPQKDATTAPNPARHRVALSLLALQERGPRWDPPDAVFSASTPPTPRTTGVVPTFAVAVNEAAPSAKDDTKGENGAPKERILPMSQPRPLTGADRLAPSTTQYTSRIPELSRTLLPTALYKRTTRLGHPPVLQRGTQKLTYGQPINAPWNTSLQPTTGPGTNSAGGLPNGTAAQPNGTKANNGSTERRLGGDGRDGHGADAFLPDARLFATWEYEQKSFREPLAPVRASKLRGAQVHFAGGTGSGTVETPTERRGSGVFTLPSTKRENTQPISTASRRDSGS